MVLSSRKRRNSEKSSSRISNRKDRNIRKNQNNHSNYHKNHNTTTTPNLNHKNNKNNKVSYKKTRKKYILSLIFITISSLLNSFSDLFFKTNSHDFITLFVIFLILGVSFVFYYFALRYSSLSSIYPFLSLSIVFSLLLSHYFLKEIVDVQKVISIILIFLGLVFVAIGKKKQEVILEVGS